MHKSEKGRLQLRNLANPLKNMTISYARTQTLKDEMCAERKARLEKLGFSDAEAAELSALHTRNFM